MTFAVLTATDVDDIIDLYQTDFADGWNKEMLISAFNTGRFGCIGATDGGRLVGVITYSKGIDSADLEGIVVKKEFRRNGIAKTLFESMEKDLLASKIPQILLEVRKSNFSAISFYQAIGFTQISERKKYYSDGENALVFLKEICYR